MLRSCVSCAATYRHEQDGHQAIYGLSNQNEQPGQVGLTAANGGTHSDSSSGIAAMLIGEITKQQDCLSH